MIATVQIPFVGFDNVAVVVNSAVVEKLLAPAAFLEVAKVTVEPVKLYTAPALS